jgi:hypothetical protein
METTTTRTAAAAAAAAAATLHESVHASVLLAEHEANYIASTLHRIGESYAYAYDVKRALRARNAAARLNAMLSLIGDVKIVRDVESMAECLYLLLKDIQRARSVLCILTQKEI